MTMEEKPGRKKSERTPNKPKEKSSHDGTLEGRDEQQKGEDEGGQGNPFDFGGLPARDLKKNLGCG